MDSETKALVEHVRAVAATMPGTEGIGHLLRRMLVTIARLAAENDKAADRIEADARKIAELEATNERLRLAVQQAGNAFYNYAQSHAAKGTPEADEKAKRNRDLCAVMDAALGGGHD